MDEVAWRTLAKGRCFVYLLPCRDEDTQKIGFARDPWVRMRQFHPRFQDFFSLDRGALIETDRVVDSRAIERQLKAAFKAQAAQAPLAIRQAAGGKREWFRGIHARAIAAMQSHAQALGYPFHAPLEEWLRGQWMAQAEVIAEWSRKAYDVAEALHFNAAREIGEGYERRLRNTLEQWSGIGIPLEDLLEGRALHWFRWGFDS